MLYAISRRPFRPPMTCSSDGLGSPKRLLVVVLEHLGTGLRELRPVLLKASQDGEVALIDHGAAEALHVTGAGLLLLVRAAARRLLLSEGRVGKRNRQQGESQKISTHRVPSF